MGIPNMLFVSEQTPQGPRQIDIYSRLLDEQIIFLNGEINDDMAESIIAQLLYLEAEEFDGDIRIYINSPGGVITAGLAIYDTMQCIKCNVATICVGQASDIQIQAKEMNRAKNLLDEILVYHTGQPIEVIEKDTDRDFFLTAEEAVEYGLIDGIVRHGEGVVKEK